MTLTFWGALLGAMFAVGVLVTAGRMAALRRPQLSARVLPYVRDLPQPSPRIPISAPGSSGAFGALVGPLMQAGANSLERVLGGATSIRRRLDRANLQLSVHDFRIQQLLWGLIGFAAAAALSLALAWRSPGRTVPLLVLCVVAFVFGVLLRENRLTAQVAAREREILAEFPTVAELLALSVSAGEGPVGALERVVRRSHGELAVDLSRVLSEIRTGTPVTRALDGLANRSGVPVVSRFAEGMAVALERGTPLAEVLQSQAADVREAGRRALIEAGARKEVAMMVPVVFLVLPVTVLFAFWPGVVGLHLVTP
ncbi:MAG TPA: type II secretion system F family protein [Nocardioidaceae bacterium]|nr:type II secretion system F family protein [Nocardioidaceae bacterium]